MTAKQKHPSSWRDLIKVHPAADLFPMMGEEELRALGEDIEKHGLTVPVVFWQSERGKPEYLIDGRNRLDAMEAIGIDTSDCLRVACKEFGCDPYALVVSLNIHRRHLTAEQKRELIANVLKAQPEKSNRQIGKQLKASHVTVGAVREELEGRGQIVHVEKRTDTKGRKQPTKKKRRDADDFVAERKAKAKLVVDNTEASPAAIVADITRQIVNAFTATKVHSLPKDEIQRLSAELARLQRWLDEMDRVIQSAT